ncbi:hypothetical protein WL82_28960 [Burkholderia ubonensis]|nr:hypothetical protein WL82_28960 [Burkholderia ubonensis]
MMIGALVITMFVSWLYLKHFSAVVEHLQTAIVVSSAPTLAALAVFTTRFKDDTVGFRDAAQLVLGPVISLALLWLLGLSIEQLPANLIGAATRQRVVDFWFTLSPDDHKALLENITSIACIGIATLVNTFMNVHTFADELIGVTESSIATRLYGISFNFRLSRAMTAQLVFVSIAWLAVTGKGIELFHQLQAYLVAILS